MNSKVLPIFLVSLLCLVQVSKCWVGTSNVKILDQALIDQGYSCQSSSENVGLMKHDEVKFLESCSKATCSHGQISYEGCGVVGAGEGCRVVPQDFSKNFPDCCETTKCGD